MQDSFLSIFSFPERIKEPYDFKNYIKRLALNLCRKKYNYLKRFEKINEKIVCVTDENKNEILKEKETLFNEILKSLSNLKYSYRETARLFYLCNYSNYEISKRLNLPSGTVKRRLYEVRKKIKREVLSMLSKEKRKDNLVPKITVEYFDGEKMSVNLKGFALAMGSVLNIGDKETVYFYDYPGGILTDIITTEVNAVVDVFGKKLFEVFVTNKNLQNETNYFEFTDKGIAWRINVKNDVFPQLEMLADHKENYAPLSYSTEDKNDKYIATVAKVMIGDKIYEKCLSVIWNLEERCSPVESFYLPNGRVILHRRFMSKKSKYQKYVNFELLPGISKKIIEGEEYRLWYDSILM